MRVRQSLAGLLPLLLCAEISAQPVIVDTGPLLFTFNTSDINNLGTPSIVATQLVFQPGLSVEAPADEQYYYDAQYFSALFSVQANPGYKLLGYSMTASGDSYVGDDATVGVSEPFNVLFYGASYYSGALAGVGPWSANAASTASLPTISFDGYLHVTTENHYSYEGFVGYYQEPYYDWVYYEYIAGYNPIFDDEGNQIGEEPYYESYSEEVIAGYYDVPIYETFYQTSGGRISLDSIVFDFQIEAAPVPVPPAVLLMGSALGLLGGLGRRCRRIG